MRSRATKNGETCRSHAQLYSLGVILCLCCFALWPDNEVFLCFVKLAAVRQLGIQPAATLPAAQEEVPLCCSLAPQSKLNCASKEPATAVLLCTIGLFCGAALPPEFAGALLFGGLDCEYNTLTSRCHRQPEGPGGAQHYARMGMRV